MVETFLLSVLLLTIPLSCIAILLSCVAIAVVVGLKNSTHRIEWKTLDTANAESPEESEDMDEEGMMEENPNKRRLKNAPFAPFPDPPKEEEPFFDEDDPNNTSHDY
jgi:hypothetical protein